VRAVFERTVLLLLFGFALCLTIRLGVAEARLRLNPEPAPPNQLRIAVSLNPRLAIAWIQLGLDAEAEGNLAEAEIDLLRAVRVDRQYVPAWTLANFYFRRGDAANFWPWARKAAARTFDDYRPLLRLADAIEPSPREVATRLGSSPPLLRAYMDILIGVGRLDAAQEIAALLASHHDPSDAVRLADLADRRRLAK
jgi:tetratricopeptide (TPR) repeat protein